MSLTRGLLIAGTLFLAAPASAHSPAHAAPGVRITYSTHGYDYAYWSRDRRHSPRNLAHAHRGKPPRAHGRHRPAPGHSARCRHHWHIGHYYRR